MSHMMRLASEAMTGLFQDKVVWLVLLTRERTAATAEECALCGGLRGAIMFPGLASVSQETLVEVVDEHEHYKFVDAEVFRCRAHAEVGEGRIRIVPDEDRLVPSGVAGFYCIAAYDDHDQELMRVDVGGMALGSQLSTLTVTMGELSV